MTADDIIALLRLAPHPEGGWYRQTWSAAAPGGEDARPSGTCIYFLLRAGERSHWHRIDADEIWIHNAGAPVVLTQARTAAGLARDRLLGSDLAAGQEPQGMVPAGWWQMAVSTGDWSLCSCAVSPGFDFDHFVLAAPDFDIPRP